MLRIDTHWFNSQFETIKFTSETHSFFVATNTEPQLSLITKLKRFFYIIFILYNVELNFVFNFAKYEILYSILLVRLQYLLNAPDVYTHNLLYTENISTINTKLSMKNVLNLFAFILSSEHILK